LAAADDRDPAEPTWLSHARRYYSQIGSESTDPVTVFSAVGEVSSEKPGQPFVHLEPRSRAVYVLHPDKGERGIIRSEGLVPAVKYVMRRNDDAVWVLSVRSVVRKRHTLRQSVGGQWTFNTPFFSQDLSGTVSGGVKLVGRVGPTMRLWFMRVEPGCDTPDVLAAVAFLHRSWWRS